MVVPVPTGRLQDKRVLVTGVGTGIGSAVAVRFADEGAQVGVNARTPQRLDTLVEMIESRGGRAHPLVGDLLQRDDVDRLRSEASDALGGAPQILVNAVGAWATSDLLATDEQTVSQLIDGNLRTIINTTTAFAPAMKKEGAGAIVNIAAVYGPMVAKQGQAVYNAAKAAVAAYTRSAARDLLDSGVRVNCVLPGGTGHEYTPDRDLKEVRRLGKSTIGAPEDVAQAILFLASDEAAWITGAQLPVDGGDSLRS